MSCKYGYCKKVFDELKLLSTKTIRWKNLYYERIYKIYAGPKQLLTYKSFYKADMKEYWDIKIKCKKFKILTFSCQIFVWRNFEREYS